MDETYQHRIEFTGENFSETTLLLGEYEACTFSQCVFAKVDLSKFTFVQCTFVDCDFSMAKLNQCTFREVEFQACKLLGLHFDYCNPFLLSFTFTDCTLNYSAFYQLKIPGTVFKNCQMEGVDFVEADLSNAVFDNCELNAAVFEDSILEGADLRTAHNFSIDPSFNRIKKAKFSRQNIIGLLGKYGIIVE